MGDTGTGPQGYSVEVRVFVGHDVRPALCEVQPDRRLSLRRHGRPHESRRRLSRPLRLATDTINSILDGTLQFAGDPQLIFSDGNGGGGTLVTCACFRPGARAFQTDAVASARSETLAIGDPRLHDAVGNQADPLDRTAILGRLLGERRDRAARSDSRRCSGRAFTAS